MIQSGIVLKALMANRLAAKKYFGYYIKMCHILITFSLPLSSKPQITLYLLKVLPSSDHQMSKQAEKLKSRKMKEGLMKNDDNFKLLRGFDYRQNNGQF